MRTEDDMHAGRSHAELVSLRKLAEDLAAARKERMTTVHLLAAVAASESAAGELLRERRLDKDALLKATRSFDEDDGTLARIMTSARELGSRGPAPEPNGLHLLLALLGDRSCGAHRALAQAGADVARIRTHAMPMALGVVATRRLTAQHKKEKPEAVAPAPTRARLSLAPGVAVPFLPPSKKVTAEAVPPPARPAAKVAPAPASVPPPASTPAPAPSSSSSNAAYVLDPGEFPVLAAIGHNLSIAAAERRFDTVVGREAEIDDLCDVLAKRHANSACLIGPAGVGKTSVVRGLAAKLVEKKDPRIVIELAASELVAGTATRGALAERIVAIISEIGRSDREIILFFDEVHELFGSGALDEAMSELKRALGKGDLSIIGATTLEEFKKAIETDAALARRFTLVEIEEPDITDAFLVVKSAANALSRHHRLPYSDEAVAVAVDWSIKYLPGRALPDKAISLLDLAGSRARRLAGNLKPSVLPKHVAEIVAEIADMPIERLLETDRERMLGLEKLFGERVVGHEPELSRIAKVLRKSAAGLRGSRPIGSFLLLGPTGVGKTETAKAIAEALFHSPDAMTRLDFSEFAEAHAIARLVGAPPGYVGHEAGGQLTEAVRRRPYQVILLDEIEKAHRDVLEAFLQVLDEGRLTDGRGRRVDFRHAVIVMTSNLGAAELGHARSERTVGFGRTQNVASNKVGEVMIAAARQHLPPELYNRIDEVLCFAPLTRIEVAEIAKRLLGDLEASLGLRGVAMDVEDGVVEVLLAAGGFDPELGARPLKRTLARLVESPLAELILKGDLDSGAVALIGVEDGEISIDAVRQQRKGA